MFETRAEKLEVIEGEKDNTFVLSDETMRTFAVTGQSFRSRLKFPSRTNALCQPPFGAQNRNMGYGRGLL